MTNSMTIRRHPTSVASLAVLTVVLLGPLIGSVARAGAPVRVQLTERLTVEIGAGQGAVVHGDRLWLLGDRGTGVIRGFDRAAARAGRLEPVGPPIDCTRGDEDLLSHPTGLAIWPEDLPAPRADLVGRRLAFIGDTVGGVGRIALVDWDLAVADGDLDRAVLAEIDDDLAVNGTRPTFVRLGERWLIATADYGGEDNAVRLYDPAALARCSRTSEPGVLVRSMPCGPYVQSLAWMDELGVLVLVQNQVPGLRYRLTFAPLEVGEVPATDLRSIEPLDLAAPIDELEGFALLGGGRCLLLSASSEDNVRLGRITLRTAAVGVR